MQTPTTPQVHVYFCNEREGGKTFEGDKKDFIVPCGGE